MKNEKSKDLVVDCFQELNMERYALNTKTKEDQNLKELKKDA